MPFAHLHLHSEYALPDGECRISELPGAVSAGGMNAVALTDPGNLYGAVAFFDKCKESGVKPIIGCEVNLTVGDKTDRVRGADFETGKIVLLCENSQGYHNLIKIVSRSYTEGFFDCPRTDFSDLKKYSKGLILLTGASDGILSKQISAGMQNRAEETAALLKDIFGENAFAEISRCEIPGYENINTRIMEIAQKLGMPPVATCDVRYTRKEDAEIYRILCAVGSFETVDDGDGRYLKTDAQVKNLFRDIPDAYENACKIAERCNFEFEYGKRELPRFKTPDGSSAYEYIEKKTKEGYARRKQKGELIPNFDEEYEKRRSYEISVISQMGFVEYFLLVADIVAFAERSKISVGPGRGSGVGCLVSYLLGITDVDPVRYGLLFERCLNPERVSMPDLDIDFCDRRRDEVFEYVNKKYGYEHTARIVTFGTFASRAAVRDTGRVLGINKQKIDEAALCIPQSGDLPLDEVIAQSKSLSKLYETDSDIKKLLDTAKKIQFRPKNVSVHPAGVVITEREITDAVPVAVNGGEKVIQYKAEESERLGLLKTDLLGLRFLSIIDDCESYIRESEPDFSVKSIPNDDMQTYKMLASGDTAALFQLESGGMKSFLAKMKPNCPEDIIIAVSIYRPGPMKSIPTFLENRKNPEKIKYPDPRAEKILKGTSGCIIYQEQVMMLCRELAGYTYSRADSVRKMMSKKKTEELAKEKKVFISGALNNGISEENANKIFDSMADFAKYAFNKSHAAAYAVPAYRTAYLKCHYRKEYLCAVLNADAGDFSKVSRYCADFEKCGGKIEKPDVNESFGPFCISGNNIRYGLGAVKGVGRAFADSLAAEREENGRFTDFADFVVRVGKTGNLKMIQALILCGACDCFCKTRNSLFAVSETAFHKASRAVGGVISGQIGLFDEGGYEEEGNIIDLAYPDLEEFSKEKLLSDEKELTGLYLTGNPLDGYGRVFEHYTKDNIPEIADKISSGESDGKEIILCGAVKTRRELLTKQKKPMAFLTLEDSYGEIGCLLFPQAYEKYSEALARGNAAVIKGTGSKKEHEGFTEISVIVNSAFVVHKDDKFPEEKEKEIKNGDIYIKITAENEDKYEKALNLLLENKGGERKLYIYREKEKKLFLFKDRKISPDGQTLKKVAGLLGEKNTAIK